MKQQQLSYFTGWCTHWHNYFGNLLAVSIKAEHTHNIELSISIPKMYPVEMYTYLCISKDMYKYVYNNTVWIDPNC